MVDSLEPPPSPRTKSISDLQRETATRILSRGLGLTPCDKLLLIYDKDIEEMAVRVLVQAQKINGEFSREYCIDTYVVEDGNKKVARFDTDLRRSLDEATASFFLTGKPAEGKEKNRIDDKEQLIRPLLKYVFARRNLRHVHLPNINEIDLYRFNFAVYNGLRR